MVEYTKSLSADFSGNLNVDKLFNEIYNSESIAPTCISVQNIGDDVKITFSESLSTGEQSELENIITNHDYTPEKITNFKETIQCGFAKNIPTSYYVVCRYLYDGSVNNNLNYVKIFSNKDSSVTSYDVRIVDFTNNMVLAEQTFNNSSYQLNDLGNILNVPNTSSVIEVQIKSNNYNQEKIYVDFVSFYIE